MPNIRYGKRGRVKDHLCPARLSSQWWQNIASLSWLGSGVALEIVRKFGDKVIPGKNLGVVLSLDFLFPWKKLGAPLDFHTL